jgi:hypothetical protein
MNRLVISDLNVNDLYSTIYDLSPLEIENLFGGGFVPGYPNVYISTFHGDVNSVSTTYEGSGNSHDNKYHTIDYARSVYVWVNSKRI